MVPSTPEELELIRQSDLFDAEWYLNTYCDVALTGMDPAEHYLKFANILRRDPSPNFSSGWYLDTHGGVSRNNVNPLVHRLTRNSNTIRPSFDTVLWGSYNLTCKGKEALGIELAERYLRDDLAYTANILHANAALKSRNESAWLKGLNGYLSHFKIAPIKLEGEGTLIDRFTTKPLPPVTEGPLISVIMPAWNAEKTIRTAVRSILNQTWRNLELLIVDDASSDGTWAELKRLAAGDDRVHILRNKINVGPYVSKNLALMQSKGAYITGHDADDWAHPQRLSNHLAEILKGKGKQASMGGMVRMQPDGRFGFIGMVGGFCLDGVARKASISCIFEREFLTKELGYWDSVRFGADSEMIARAEALLKGRFKVFHQIGMICLDLEGSLTNHAQHGVDRVAGISPIRKRYRDSWKDWHIANLPQESAYLAFPQKERHYPSPPEMVVPNRDIRTNMDAGERSRI